MNISSKKNISLMLIGITLGLLSACKQSSSQNGSAPNNSKARATDTSATNSSALTANGNSSEPIVYIDSDSLLSKYDYYKEVKTDMEAKGKRLQADVERKGRGFQAEVQAYQSNAVNLTPDQKKTTEQRLGKKQQELQLYQQTLSQSLGKEEQEINQKLYDKVQTYLKDYCSINKHKMVMTYSKGGNLLYGDKSLDVTTEVVKGLNIAYAKEKLK